jgi:hypothetical protein
VPSLTPPAFRLSPGLPVTRHAAAYASSVMAAGISPMGPVEGEGAVTVAWGLLMGIRSVQCRLAEGGEQRQAGHQPGDLITD